MLPFHWLIVALHLIMLDYWVSGKFMLILATFMNIQCNSYLIVVRGVRVICNYRDTAAAETTGNTTAKIDINKHGF